MIRRFAVISTMAIALPAATLGARQAQIQIQNGRVEQRTATSVEREIATIGSSATDPVWVAWREPMIDGARNMCSFYMDRDHPNGVRGDVLDGGFTIYNGGDMRPPQITPPAGPAQLEGGTQVVVLARLVDKRVERLHTIGDDCPVDANGRVVYWLNGVSVADSLKYLETLARPDISNMTRGGASSLVSEATGAIALHRDAGADAILDRLATSDPDSTLRRRAVGLLGSHRGAHGFETLRRLLDTEKTTEGRRAIVSALAQTRQPQTADVLLGLAKSDSDPQIRAEAVYYVPARGGDRVVTDVVAIADKDQASEVRRRAVSGLGQMPNDTGLTALIQLARTSTDTVVRKQAVTEIGRSKDPRAAAYLHEIIGK
jgi:hypothetical protein